MPVPYTFQLSTLPIPLANLDANFTYFTTAISVSGTNVTVAGTTTTAAAVVNANNATNALRITQVGTGNALVVEDSANPDATPFVIDATGKVAIGSTTAAENLNLVSDGRNFLQLTRASTDSIQSVVAFRKARGTNAAPTIVANADVLGDTQFYGYDGAAYVTAASIQAQLDGTPGTNAMPGRLVFSTTADGASSPTERMRIDNAGRVGVGAVPVAGTNFYLSKNITGAVSSFSMGNFGQIQSDVTTEARYFSTAPSTAAAAFTLADLRHYVAFQGTFGAGSTVTNQMAFYVGANLTGATNNYGFYSAIASGTGRYNFYAAGTATNYMAGNTYIGAIFGDDTKFAIGGTLPSAGAASYGARVVATMPSTTTSGAIGFDTNLSTQAAAYTLNTLNHYSASQGTIGAGSTVTNQYGYIAQATLIGATNNYGFFSNIAAATGRYNFYASGTADNYMAGKLGIASTNTTALSVEGGARIGNATATTGLTVQSAINWNFSPLNVIRSAANTSTPRLIAMPLGGDSLSSASIGDYNAIWGIYNASPSAASTSSALQGEMAFAAYYGHRWYVNGTERMRIDSAGRVGIGGAPTSGAILLVNKNPNDGAFSDSVYVNGTIQSNVTSRSASYVSSPSVVDASFTLSTWTHFGAFQGTKGASATVINQYGFNADASLTGATNNYGFYGNIASGTGRFNFYANGTAANVFVGTTSIGGAVGAESLRVTPVAGAVNYLQAQGATTATPFFSAQGSSTDIDMGYVAKGAGFHTFYTGGTSYLVQFQVKNTTSAVNFLQVTGGATGFPVTFSAQGSDTNIQINHVSKGTGNQVFIAGTTTQFVVATTASSVNYLNATGAATGSAPSIFAGGSDTNVDIALYPQGTGVLRFGTYTAGALSATGYITIKDAAGNTRRLLVG